MLAVVTAGVAGCTTQGQRSGAEPTIEAGRSTLPAPTPDPPTPRPRAASTPADVVTTAPEDGAAHADPTPSEPTLEHRVQALLHAYDTVLAEIGADPGIASNRTHAAYTQLRALLAPDSPMATPLINAFVAAGARGERQVPHGDSALPVERVIDGAVEVVSPDEWSVHVCGHMNYDVFNNRDEQIELAEGHVEATRVNIVRIDDGLRIHHFEPGDDDRCWANAG